MIKKTLTINNKMGLHCRPCSEIVNAAKQYESDIFIIKDDEYANVKKYDGYYYIIFKTRRYYSFES